MQRTQYGNNLILQLYKQDYTQEEFIKILRKYYPKIGRSVMHRKSKKLGLTFKENRGAKPSVLINPFSLGDYDNDYWFGYLLGDGSISGSTIKIFSVDLDHLLSYAHHLDFKGSSFIKKPFDNNRAMGMWYFGNSEIKKYLKTLGVKEDKRYTSPMYFKLNFEILRGLFDADGYCRVRNNSIEFKITTSNLFIVKRIASFYQNNGCDFSTRKKGSSYDVFLIGGQDKVVPFLNRFYKNGQYHLHRKFVKLGDYIEQSIYENRVNCWNTLRAKTTTTELETTNVNVKKVLDWAISIHSPESTKSMEKVQRLENEVVQPIISPMKSDTLLG